MYIYVITPLSLDALKELNLQSLFSMLIFLILTFLGVAARVSIDIEIFNKKLRDVKFLHRYFLATVLSYVIEIFISEKQEIRKYYSEIIIIFCIFVNDIIMLSVRNFSNLFVYALKTFTKGMVDLTDKVTKEDKKEDNEQNRDNISN